MRIKQRDSISGDFLKWLIKEKKLKEKSAKDVISRLQRVTKIVSLDDSYYDEDYVYYLLSKSEVFKSLSVSVKSHLKRSACLYLEFLHHYRKIHNPSLF
jgi:hypothetical protein